MVVGFPGQATASHFAHRYHMGRSDCSGHTRGGCLQTGLLVLRWERTSKGLSPLPERICVDPCTWTVARAVWPMLSPACLPGGGEAGACSVAASCRTSPGYNSGLPISELFRGGQHVTHISHISLPGNSCVIPCDSPGEDIGSLHLNSLRFQPMQLFSCVDFAL